MLKDLMICLILLVHQYFYVQLCYDLYELLSNLKLEVLSYNITSDFETVLTELN